MEKSLQSVPDLPGVYRFLAADGSILYVGKAKSLKKRIRSYFTGVRSAKTQALVRQADDVEVTVTDSPFEALLLENTFIKKYQPKYNILLKDDRSYPYLKITTEKFPRLVMAYRNDEDGAQFFGPYPSSTEAQLVCQVLNEAFPIVKSKTCGSRAPCFYYHLGMCLSPYYFAVDPAVYQGMIDQIVDFLSGNQERVLNLLRDRMYRAASLRHFEAAAKLQNQINNLEHLHNRQKVVLNRALNLDVLGYATTEGGACLYMLVIRQGILLDGFGTIIESQDDIFEDVREFIERYYIDKPVPQTLLLPILVQSDIFPFKSFSAVVPRRGLKRHLLHMAETNARVYLDRRISKSPL